ncbi:MULTISPECIES: DUF4365 domain-containing protein [Paraburkholderia]|uniref:DUF4365 domain-containing protein n=1 Tax=Paraburkholderia madseniana TaxID=2599607 RepID=A0AAP5ESD7_9BURK|nr:MULTISPECIES: DUF4365 domain-containing protein [Paraburkholderia]MCX4150016.1 DUF4365 domain-containing protein [Paraburkholderia madseniana]MCX4175693.1 DUF4365 domain-containing protein [Paraburkholderia madseniana]MDN7152952.1 DUF4365 domain-containing protein [Paraburkholderia sp. WS6]MDQ6411834.1 DUF4365 domain-containing protein [Paraburkholderia madseniana]MDQ6463688.1 DUF4365 domain-containing protein [Paraburkholderia madseniana]
MARFNATEQIGVNAVQQIVLKELEWIFREQPVIDMGIDAHIELVDKQPTGKLIAVQIKTGPSHFAEAGDAYIFRGKLTHLDYWTNHSLPVILVAHFIESGQTFWVQVDENLVKRTGKSWTIPIPKANKLGAGTREALMSVFDGSPSQQRMRKLAIDEPLMRHISEGGKVSVELEDWMHKSLGRSTVQVFIHDEHGREILKQEWLQYFTGYNMKALAEALFPWSVASVDEDFYEENNEFDEDPRLALMRATDEDNGYFAISNDPDEVYPYANSGGEVDCYRLKLELNDPGKAFLLVSDYTAGAE